MTACHCIELSVCKLGVTVKCGAWGKYPLPSLPIDFINVDIVELSAVVYANNVEP